MFRYPRVGDEVRTTKATTTSLWGGTVRPGAHAVVLSVGWIRTSIKVDTGRSFATVNVPTSSLRVIRRGVGEDRFTERGEVIHLARFGVMLAMIAPFAFFTVRYVMATGGVDGLIETITFGLVQSAVDVVQLAFTNPIRTGIYVVFGWALWRFAFPRSG